MTEILDRLTAELPSLSPKLARVARFALDNPDRIALDSMRSVASACDVASPTALRLARHVGFDSYGAFKEQFTNVVTRQGFSSRAVALRNTRESNDDETVVSYLFDAALDNLNRTSINLDVRELQQMARLMQRARTPYVIASESIHWLASGFHATGRMALPSLRVQRADDASLVDMLGTVDGGDVFLIMAISPYAKSTIDAAKFLWKHDVTVLAITDKRSSPLLEFAAHHVLAETTSPHFFPSVVSVLAVVEALLALVVANGGEAMTKRINQIEALREQGGSFLF